MANEKRLIDANDFLDLFYVASAGQDKAFIKAVEMVVEDTPTVDAVEVKDPELLKAIELLIKQYDKSKASEYVHNPVAHALYHTWKQVDERR